MTYGSMHARRSARWSAWIVAAVGALSLAGCGDDESPTPQPGADTGGDAADVDATDDTTPDDTTPSDASEDTERPDVAPDADVAPDGGADGDTEEPREDYDPNCDPLQPSQCAFPWPSSLYLAEDPTRATGFTLRFGERSLPVNFRGVHIDPAPYERMDGYGVSTPLLVFFPHLDVSAMPDDYTVAGSMAEDAQILLYRVGDDEAMERVPYWVDLDDWEPDPARKTLYIRPGVILEEGSRYVVALRNLRDVDGAPYPRSEAFDRLVRGDTAGSAMLEARAPRFADLLARLEGAGVDLSEVDLAWDFVTASGEALHGPMLHMRRDGLERVGPSGPAFTFTDPEITPDDDHPHWAWVLRGTIEVPDYMRPEVVEESEGELVGWVFNLGEDGLPTSTTTREAGFYIGVPHSAIDGPAHGLVQYGHGFFGTARGTIGSWTHNGQLANEHNVIFFGCFLTGMAEYDYGTTQFMVFDFSHFPWLADRIHQGLLEYILLARSMKERFATLEWTESQGITIDPARMYYLGISQGGIFGATYMALAPDIERGHLGVPGQNYSLMEHRSTNFDQFFTAINGAYRGRDNQAVVISAVQTLWDQTDPASYWRHITAEPFEDGPPRYVLAAPSKGDLQVTTVSMEVVARTNLGVATMENYDAERGIDLVTETPYPHTGSAIVLYDFGFPWPAAGVNRPPTFSRDDVDAHNAPRRNEAHNAQMFHFFETGEVIDTCEGAPCAFPPN